MKNIYFNEHTDLKKLFKLHDLTADMFVTMQIGYDDKVYILFSADIPERIDGMFVNTCANTFYYALVLTVDWYEGAVLHCEKLDLGHHEMNFHFIQPIGDNILLLGSRCRYRNDGPENNAVIVGPDGSIKEKFCLGDGIEDLIVTDSGDMITSYFDEGVYGNFGWDEPIGNCGLIAWSSDKQIKWKADRWIDDCYAIYLDVHGNLWYYYDTDFLLVKTDFRSETEYEPRIRGASRFLVTSDMGHLIMEGGYNKYCEFGAARLNGGTVGDYEDINFLYNDKNIVIKRSRFRGSKIVFIDDKYNIFLKEIFSLY